MTRAVEDLSVVVAGQGGDGSVTLVSLLGRAAAGRGYHVYEAREVGSRVKGGPAVASLRVSTLARRGVGDSTDLLVAFDPQALEQQAGTLRPGGYVIYDSSDGPAPRSRLPRGTTVIEAPLSRLAVRDLRRDLYKNALAFGIAARLFAMPHAVAEAVLTAHLGKLPESLRDANRKALRRGLQYADETLPREHSPWSLAHGGTEPRLLMTGNEAIALGFLVSGGRFFAGYPITPASEILEWLAEHLPAFGGVAVQAEDELAAINLAIGATLTGTRAMTASSGPGIALMQEGVGHLASAEIGLLIVDCQRAGPSTGMPTKPEQSDISMLIYGGNGDVPRIVLAPGDQREAFDLTRLAMDLADRYQGPVYLAVDQAISQNATTMDLIDLDGAAPDRGKLLSDAALGALAEFRRYSLEPADGISPRAAFGTPGGQHLVTGNERDEWGLVTTQPATRARMMRKRAAKVDAIASALPRARIGGDPHAEIALVGTGMETGPMLEAAERLAARDLPVRVVQPRTLWPVLDDVRELVSSCCTYVIEHNASAQFGSVLAGYARGPGHVHNVLRYDGLPFTARDIIDAVEQDQYS